VRWIALWIVTLVATQASAEPLEVDKCRAVDAGQSDDERRKRGAEYYRRGETLYLQGDYLGAVSEFVASYCVIPYYQLLKDIGQCFERSLDYERAIRYYERYVEAVPVDAKRTSQCAVDPQEDLENMRSRVRVLRDLRAHIAVQTNPPGAQIELALATEKRIVARAITGQPSAKDIAVPGAAYVMTVSLGGFERETLDIRVDIGKPYTYFFNLRRQKGTVVIQATPADARIFVDDKLVGIGRFEGALEAKKYAIATERNGFEPQRREVELRAGELRRVSFELDPKAQFGRRQLIAYATGGGAFATGALLNAFNQTIITSLGGLVGAAGGLAGTMLFLDEVPLGTSNLAITSSLGGAVLGYASASAFTGNQRVVAPVAGASAILGAGLGYYFGDETKVRTGDAALLNSSLLWGTAAGGFFALAFGSPRDISAGLVLSGLAMGGISGGIMMRYFNLSRTRSLLIDIGGLAGILGGLAIAGIAYPPPQDGTGFSDEQKEHFANFALGGMAVGLIGAGLLTRNLDAPKLKLQPTIGSATGVDGSRATTFGFVGSF
jgi:tetratricopeptide (TPR) repeat protein